MLDTPHHRILWAAMMAAPVVAAARRRFREQLGGDPVLVVARPDCTGGAAFIRAAFGPKAPEAMSAPVVLAFSMTEFLGHVAEHQREALAADFAEAKPGNALICFACNDSQLVNRVLPDASPETLKDAASPLTWEDWKAYKVWHGEQAVKRESRKAKRAAKKH